MNWLDPATVLFRGVHVAGMLSLFGCLVFRCVVVPASERAACLRSAATRRIALISASVALASGGLWLACVAGAMTGADSVWALPAAVPRVVRYSGFGHLQCARLLLLACLIGLLWWSARDRGAGVDPAAGDASRVGGAAITGASLVRRWAAVATLPLSGAVLMMQPLLGHIGALPAGARATLAPVAMAHVLAAGAWLGGLLPLLLCVARCPPGLAAILCERFTPLGLVAVGAIATTALPQAGELIGGLGGLAGTAYGHFALLKLACFGLALGLAAANRLVLTPRLGALGRDEARRWMFVSIAAEIVVVLTLVLAAAAMASSPPAAHVQPEWPFAWRPSMAAWDVPTTRPPLERLLIVTAVSLVLIGGGLLWRRFRVVAVLVALPIVAPSVPALSLLLVEAYPTSYARSSTGFSVGAIGYGKALYDRNCAACHDARDGTGAGGDLLAAHFWGHLEGDLYWWISNGVADDQGAAVMPAFGSMLTDEDRWVLIDYLRARNVGAQLRRTGHWEPPVPAPEMPLRCDGLAAHTVGDLAGRMAIVIADGGPATDLPDVVTIRLTVNAQGTPAAGACLAVAEAAWAGWTILSGMPTNGLAGYRALIDARGWLRAVFPPDVAADRVREAARDAREHPIAVLSRVEHQH